MRGLEGERKGEGEGPSEEEGKGKGKWAVSLVSVCPFGGSSVALGQPPNTPDTPDTLSPWDHIGTLGQADDKRMPKPVGLHYYLNSLLLHVAGTTW